MASFPEFEFINLQEPGPRIVEVSLNRPRVLNAINSAMANELSSAFKFIACEMSSHVVVVSAAGDRAFCAGADLRERDQVPFDERKKAHLALENLALTMSQISMPVVAAVFGHCIGGGFELALLADIVIGDETTSFGFREVSYGIIPGMGGATLLSRRIGTGRAKEIVLSERVVAASEALRLGIMDVLVESAELRSRALSFAEALATKPSTALRLAKRAVDETTSLDIAGALRTTFALYETALESPESCDRLRECIANKKKARSPQSAQVSGFIRSEENGE